MNTVVIANFEIHGALLEKLSNSNHCNSYLVKHLTLTYNRNSNTFVMIMRCIFRIDPLTFGYSFFRATAKLGCEIMQKFPQEAKRNPLSIIKAHRD